MGLLGTTTQQSYYSQTQNTWAETINGVGSTGTLTFGVTTVYFPTRPTQQANITVFIDGVEIKKDTYSYNGTAGVDVAADDSYNIVFHNTNGVNSDLQATNGAPLAGKTLLFKETVNTEKFGTYRYISLKDIVNNFIIGNVGDMKLIGDVNRSEVLFHAKRGIQEFSYDVSRVEKIQEVDVGPSLSVPMPQDYVNYVQLSWVDTGGIEHLIYPGRYTSRPSESILQDSVYDYLFDSDGTLLTNNPSSINTKFNALDINNLSGNIPGDSYYLHSLYYEATSGGSGTRYGLDPETAQKNGVFIIDEANGKFGFSSDMSGRTITIKYISDGLGTDAEMQVHKFAEEAIYKHIAFSILSSHITTPEYVVERYRKQRRAAMRNTKLRLSNIKLGEIMQVMKGKSKHIKN